MLEIRQIANAAGAARYFAKPDVQISGYDLPQQVWHGKLAQHLGLIEFTPQSFARLMHNQHPETGKPLTSARRDDRTPAYEFCATAPKSASIALTVGGDTRIIGAFIEATDAMMAEAETLMHTRVRKGKQDHDRPTENLAYTGFLHLTGREDKGKVDGHLHGHLVVPNETLDPVEGKIKAGQFRPVKTEAPYLQAVFHNEFARNLKKLGYEIEPTRHGFEIQGIPERSIREFSTRKTIIDRAAELLNVFTGKGKQHIARTTREKKSTPSQWADLTDGWQARCRADDLRAIRQTVEQAIPREIETRDAEVASRVQRRHPRMSDRDRLTKALTRNVGEVTLEGLKREAKPHRSLRERLTRHISFMGMNRERSFERERPEPTLGIG